MDLQISTCNQGLSTTSQEEEESRFHSSLTGFFFLTYPLYAIQSRACCASYLAPAAFLSFPPLYEEAYLLKKTASAAAADADDDAGATHRTKQAFYVQCHSPPPLLAQCVAAAAGTLNVFRFLLASLRVVYIHEGFPGLFRGLVPATLHIIARDAVNYYLVRHYLNKTIFLCQKVNLSFCEAVHWLFQQSPAQAALCSTAHALTRTAKNSFFHHHHHHHEDFENTYENSNKNTVICPDYSRGYCSWLHSFRTTQQVQRPSLVITSKSLQLEHLQQFHNISNFRTSPKSKRRRSRSCSSSLTQHGESGCYIREEDQHNNNRRQASPPLMNNACSRVAFLFFNRSCWLWGHHCAACCKSNEKKGDKKDGVCWCWWWWLDSNTRCRNCSSFNRLQSSLWNSPFLIADESCSHKEKQQDTQSRTIDKIAASPFLNSKQSADAAVAASTDFKVFYKAPFLKAFKEKLTTTKAAAVENIKPAGIISTCATASKPTTSTTITTTTTSTMITSATTNTTTNITNTRNTTSTKNTKSLHSLCRMKREKRAASATVTEILPQILTSFDSPVAAADGAISPSLLAESKEVGKEVGKELSKEVGKEGGKELSKEVGKELRKEVGKELSKEVGKEPVIFLQQRSAAMNDNLVMVDFEASLSENVENKVFTVGQSEFEEKEAAVAPATISNEKAIVFKDPEAEGDYQTSKAEVQKREYKAPVATAAGAMVLLKKSKESTTAHMEKKGGSSTSPNFLEAEHVEDTCCCERKGFRACSEGSSESSSRHKKKQAKDCFFSTGQKITDCPLLEILAGKSPKKKPRKKSTHSSADKARRRRVDTIFFATEKKRRVARGFSSITTTIGVKKSRRRNSKSSRNSKRTNDSHDCCGLDRCSLQQQLAGRERRGDFFSGNERSCCFFHTYQQRTRPSVFDSVETGQEETTTDSKKGGFLWRKGPIEKGTNTSADSAVVLVSRGTSFSKAFHCDRLVAPLLLKLLSEALVYPLLTVATRLVVMEGPCNSSTNSDIFSGASPSVGPPLSSSIDSRIGWFWGAGAALIRSVSAALFQPRFYSVSATHMMHLTYAADGLVGFYGGLIPFLISRCVDDGAHALARLYLSLQRSPTQHSHTFSRPPPPHLRRPFKQSKSRLFSLEKNHVKQKQPQKPPLTTSYIVKQKKTSPPSNPTDSLYCPTTKTTTITTTTTATTAITKTAISYTKNMPATAASLSTNTAAAASTTPTVLRTTTTSAAMTTAPTASIGAPFCFADFSSSLHNIRIHNNSSSSSNTTSSSSSSSSSGKNILNSSDSRNIRNSISSSNNNSRSSNTTSSSSSSSSSSSGKNILNSLNSSSSSNTSSSSSSSGKSILDSSGNRNIRNSISSSSSSENGAFLSRWRCLGDSGGGGRRKRHSSDTERFFKKEKEEEQQWEPQSLQQLTSQSASTAFALSASDRCAAFKSKPAEAPGVVGRSRRAFLGSPEGVEGAGAGAARIRENNSLLFIEAEEELLASRSDAVKRQSSRRFICSEKTGAAAAGIRGVCNSHRRNSRNSKSCTRSKSAQEACPGQRHSLCRSNTSPAASAPQSSVLPAPLGTTPLDEGLQQVEAYALKACFSAVLSTAVTPLSQLSLVQRCQSNLEGLCTQRSWIAIFAAMPWKAFFLQLAVSLMFLGLNTLMAVKTEEEAHDEETEERERNAVA